MRLLFITQKVDVHDSVLGFTHSWLLSLAPHFEKLHVICLAQGQHQLPAHVTVHSLGKESGGSRFKYIARFWSILRRISGEYDTVFVHMNEEYVLLAGWYWRLRHIPVYLWRNHLEGSWRTRVAGLLSKKVFYTSPQSFTAPFKNSIQMPVGIDTSVFTPGTQKRDGVLILGRMDPVKHVLEMIDAAVEAAREVPFTLTLVGDTSKSQPSYANAIEERLSQFPGTVIRKKAVPHHETVSYYQRADILLNFTQAGSFDKTIFEAAASGVIVLTTNVGLNALLPEECIVSMDTAGKQLSELLTLDSASKDSMRNQSQYFAQQQSLKQLTRSLSEILTI